MIPGHITLILEGVDGSVWDLRDGPVRAGRGIKGLGKIVKRARIRKTTQTEGQRLLGVSAEAREIVMPVIVNHSRPDDEWFAHDRAFWSALKHGEYCTLYVGDPVGDVRSIAVRFEDDSDYEFDYDPSDIGLTDATITLVADDGYFRGHEVRIAIEPPPGDVDFYGPDGVGPDFYIGADGAVDAQIVSNPGDEDTWPVWESYGPMTSFEYTVDGAVYSGTIDIPEGGKLIADTRPNVKSTILTLPDGTTRDVFRELSGIEFAPIPNGDRVPITVKTTGAGITILSYFPLYSRGF